MIIWVIKIRERTGDHVLFDLFANNLGQTKKTTGPCGLTMELSTFEDFCMELGIDYDHVFNLQ